SRRRIAGQDRTSHEDTCGTVETQATTGPGGVAGDGGVVDGEPTLVVDPAAPCGRVAGDGCVGDSEGPCAVDAAAVAVAAGCVVGDGPVGQRHGAGVEDAAPYASSELARRRDVADDLGIAEGQRSRVLDAAAGSDLGAVLGRRWGNTPGDG